MNLKLLFTGLFFLILININAQKEVKDSITRPFQITFITPLGTNGTDAPGIINQLSFNILAGYNGGVDGFELGGFLNLCDEYVKGVQIAGFGNIVGGNTSAAQIAGFMNIDGGEVSGLQTSGFMNMGDDINGVQVAGFLNTARDIEGLQTAGFLNVARNVKGVQIAGFINICDTIDGLAIAPISIVKKGGYRRFEFWGNETFFMNTSFKIGVRHLYTIYTLGFKPVSDDFNTGIGFGIGSNIGLSSDKSIDLEAHTYFINRYFWENWYYNYLNQLRISFNYQISEHFSIFAGPTLNLLVADIDTYADDIAPSWAFKISDGRDSIRGWFGFNIGMRF